MTIDRRDFLKVGVLGAVALTEAPTVAEARPVTLNGPEVERFLAHLDENLDGISRARTLGRLLPEEAIEAHRDEPSFQRGDELFKKGLRSLLLVGSLHDLPEEARLHPGMQERLWRAQPEMDEAVVGLATMMESLTPAERLDLTQALEEDPRLAMRVVEAIDEEASRLGVSHSRRSHLRTITLQILWRMRHQGPAAIVDEYTERVHKVVARHGSNAESERRLAARMGETAFWAYQQRVEATSRAWLVDGEGGAGGVAAAPATGPGLPPLAPPTNAHRQYAANTSKVLTAGGVLLGLGVLLTGVGTVMVAAGASSNNGGTAIAGAFVITPGAVSTLMGIVMLIIGAVRRWAED